MTEKTTKKPLKIRAYHSETSVKKGESTAAYKARIASEKAAELEEIRAKKVAEIEAQKRGKIKAKLLLELEIILSVIAILITSYFIVNNINNFAWISSPYVYISTLISLIIVGILNRTLTFIEKSTR